MFKAIILIPLFFFQAQLSYGKGAKRQFYKVKTGMFSYDVESIVSSSGSNSSNLSVEYGQYNDGTKAKFVEFRIALQEEQRVLYQAMYIGSRYYFLNSGYSYKNTLDDTLIEYSQDYGVYAHYKGGIGRYLVGVFGTQAINDGSVTFLALNGGVGTSYRFSQYWNAFFEVEFEIDTGLFGPFDLTATNLFIQAGIQLDL